MSIGLIGKKAGMSRLFQEDGTSIPVTIVSVAGNFVTDIKTSDRDGYSSVVISKQFFKKKKLKNRKLNISKNIMLTQESYMSSVHLMLTILK